MKKILLAIAMVFSLLTVNAALVTVNWASNHSANGGEFVLSDPLNIAPSFNTFCLERNEYINPGSTYSYLVSDRTDGGMSGPNDPISIGTAWLYSNFRNGSLTGYSSTFAQQTDLQNTIWYLEGEIASLGNTSWFNLAQTALGNQVNLFSDAHGLFGVGVWNLYAANGGHAQSQLGIVPVPEPASWIAGAFLLLPFGISTLRVFRLNSLFQKP